MHEIHILIDTVSFKQAMEAAYSNQFPFAIKEALNGVGFSAPTDVQNQRRRALINRGPWTIWETIVEKARKDSLVVEVGSIRPYMKVQALGGIKPPGTRRTSLSNPTDNLISRTKVPSRKTKWARPLPGVGINWYKKVSSISLGGIVEPFCQKMGLRKLWLLCKRCQNEEAI